MFHNRNKKQKTSDHQLANYKQIAMFPSYRILISNELEKLIYASTSKWSKKQRTPCYMILFSWNSEKQNKTIYNIDWETRDGLEPEVRGGD